MAVLDALRHGGKPVEVGRLTYPPAQLARTRAAWRARARREVLSAERWAVPLGIVAGSLSGLMAASAAGDLAGAGTALVVLGGAAALPYRRLDGLDGPVRSWAAWRIAWDQAARCLRTGLDRSWTICWDRRLPGWVDPVTIAVGPSGIWAIWVAPPGVRNDPHALANQMGEIFPEGHHGLSVQVRTGEGRTHARWWRQVVTEMVCANLSASPGDCHRFLTRIEQTTLADLEAIRDG